MPENRIGPLRKAKGFTLEQLAERTGLSVTYLSRLQSGERILSVENAERLATAFEVSPAEVLGLEQPHAAQRRLGFSDNDLEPYQPGPGDPLPKPRGPNEYYMTVKSDCLANLGIRKGDRVLVDGSAAICKSPPPLAAVRVQHHPDPDQMLQAVTLLRQFVPPSKLITNAPGVESPALDLDRDDAQILGVVTWAHRRIG